MNHEQECNVVLLDEQQRAKMPPWTCNCEQIRTAYKRGREEAAAAVWTTRDLHHCNGEVYVDIEIAYMRAKGKTS